MKNLLFLFLFSLALLAAASEKIPAIYTVKGELDKSVGHIQGACASQDHLYLSHMKGIFKLDRNGKVLAHATTVSHTGDICFYNGKIYSAVAYYDKARNGRGAIKEYSADLKELRTYELDNSSDGITAMNGFLYFGIGPNPQKLHRGNKVAKLPVDMSGKPEIFEIDHGYPTHFGVQTMTNDGKNIFMSFYGGGAKNTCHSAAFTPELKLVKAIKFSASIGFDVFPGVGSADDPVFFKLCSINKRKEKPLCRFDFYKYVNGEMVKITKYPENKK